MMAKALNRVNFLIIGAQKCGTTALAQFLSEHPDVCMAPEKEIHFFDFDDRYYNADGRPNYDRYHASFTNYDGQSAVGEATPIYLFLPFIAERLRSYNPDLKLIVILRNPIDRAYSQYQMEFGRKTETLPFSIALRLEKYRISKRQDLSHAGCSLRCHSYATRGFYYAQIENLLKFFDRSQILFLQTEDLARKHDDTLKQIYDFLNISRILPPAPEKVFSNTYAPMSKPDRNFLKRKLQSDIKRLEDLLSWQTSWLQ